MTENLNTKTVAHTVTLHVGDGMTETFLTETPADRREIADLRWRGAHIVSEQLVSRKTGKSVKIGAAMYGSCASWNILSVLRSAA